MTQSLQGRLLAPHAHKDPLPPTPRRKKQHHISARPDGGLQTWPARGTDGTSKSPWGANLVFEDSGGKADLSATARPSDPDDGGHIVFRVAPGVIDSPKPIPNPQQQLSAASQKVTSSTGEPSVASMALWQPSYPSYAVPLQTLSCALVFLLWLPGSSVRLRPGEIPLAPPAEAVGQRLP